MCRCAAERTAAACGRSICRRLLRFLQQRGGDPSPNVGTITLTLIPTPTLILTLAL